jgi:hypothetical protein
MSEGVADPGVSFLEQLAEDVTVAGTIVNGVIRGREAVIAQIRATAQFYEDRVMLATFDHAEWKVDEYRATVAGRVIYGNAMMHRNAEGRYDRIVVNHRPLSAALTLSRLVGESEADRADRDLFFHPDGQTYQDLLAYAETHGES